MCDREKYHLPSAKKMEALSSVKMTVENCLGTINMCLFCISLTMVTPSTDCNCGTLMVALFCKRHQLLRQSIALFRENARHHTPNWTAVYGCTSDRLWISLNLVLSVLSLTESLRSTWLASDCNRCWCEASYHLLVTDTRQHSLPWNISLGTIVGQMPR